MTATVAPPDAPRRSGDRRPAARPPVPEAPPSLVAAELALLATTAAAVASYGQVFDGWSYLPRLLVAAVAAHALAAVVRRRRVPVVLAALVLLAGFVLAATWVLFPATTTLGAPTGATLQQATDAVRDGWSGIGEEDAPVRAAPGFLLLAFAATWVTAAVADRAAFRWHAVLQPLVPSFALLLVSAVLAEGTDAVALRAGALALGAYVLAAGTFAVLQRQLVADRRGWRWTAGGARRGRRALVLTGLLLAATASGVAVLAGPRLPGGDREALVEWRSDGGDDDRQTVSPLVDIQTRLVQQSDQVLFTVDADAPAYWRTTALDVFDGRIWRSRGRFAGADGALTIPEGQLVGDELVEQRVEVVALDQIWLPAAFRPVAVEPGGTPMRYDAESATLIVDSELESSDGTAYTVRSAPAPQDPTVLGAATDPPPPEVAERYLALPDDFSELAQQQAVEATDGAVTPYDQAVALEAYFRDGFEYSLDVRSGHGDAAIDDFLVRRTGYCEQFAGTYAAMARSVGLPSRVAVGYIPGESDPATADRYVVRGRDAHAWPEVWLTGVGWVAMEPTPSRSQPVASTTTSTTAPAATPTTPSTAAPPTTTADGAEQASDVPAPGGGLPTWLVVGGAIVVALGGAALVGARLALATPGALVARQHDDREQAAAQVRAAWDLVVDDLRAAGVRARPAETPSELARRAATLDLVPPATLARLARAATAARFAPDGVDPSGASRAVADAAAVSAAVQAEVGRRRWVRHRVDPRRLLRSWRATRPRA